MSDTEAVADLIESGRCTPACICAIGDDDGTCTCRCGGEWHGAVAGVAVERASMPTSWVCEIAPLVIWEGASWADIQYPVTVGVDAFNREYRKQRAARDPYFIGIEKRRRNYSITFDAFDWPAPWGKDGIACRPAFDGFRAFAVELMKAGRIRQFAGGPDYVNIDGIKTIHEAQMIAYLMEESAILHFGATELVAKYSHAMGMEAAA